MSKKQIHTNLVGRVVRITEEAGQFGMWHANKGPLWEYSDPSDVTTAKFLGDFAKMPGGKNATAEIVTIHLTSDGNLVASLQWSADGTIQIGLHIEYLQVLPADPE